MSGIGVAMESESWSDRTRRAAREVLAGRRKGLRALLPFAGPAFIASVAYMDPGNFATNVQAGSLFGYRLLWVVVFANITAMLFQALSAKLGIVTGKNLPEVCRERFSKRTAIGMWIVSEIAAMATDLAELLGAAIGLALLFHLPLLLGVVLTALATYAVLLMQSKGFRQVEGLIVALVGVIAVCYVLETVLARPNWGQVAYHAVVPWLGSPAALVLAVGIIGATVMPHAIYLHSSLTQDRIVPENSAEAGVIVRFSNIDVLIALGLAGVVNLAMMYMSAAVFHFGGHLEVASIESAYKTLSPLLGSAAASIFLLSLMASGISSSVVGTMAGQVIMQGFVGFAIPLWVRRVVTMIPTVVIVAIGVDATHALVLSQVVLSLVLPLPIVVLLMFTSKRSIMASLVNTPTVKIVGILAAALVVFLNVGLLWQTFGLPFPGMTR
ncbi:MAG: Nramp family divalent metal transporter [Candidatus Eremiobacteraeota bacterium]|nr:Nramp family divalent metal transporter [Candidatus Eremiobacteraeota bacterium]